MAAKTKTKSAATKTKNSKTGSPKPTSPKPAAKSAPLDLAKVRRDIDAIPDSKLAGELRRRFSTGLATSKREEAFKAQRLYIAASMLLDQIDPAATTVA
jgi:hypothetical protein